MDHNDWSCGSIRGPGSGCVAGQGARGREAAAVGCDDVGDNGGLGGQLDSAGDGREPDGRKCDRGARVGWLQRRGGRELVTSLVQVGIAAALRVGIPAEAIFGVAVAGIAAEGIGHLGKGLNAASTSAAAVRKGDKSVLHVSLVGDADILGKGSGIVAAGASRLALLGSIGRTEVDEGIELVRGDIDAAHVLEAMDDMVGLSCDHSGQHYNDKKGGHGGCVVQRVDVTFLGGCQVASGLV